jgi:hypothetical protein
MQSTLVVSEVQNYDPLITLGSVLWLSFALPLLYSMATVGTSKENMKVPTHVNVAILIFASVGA